MWNNVGERVLKGNNICVISGNFVNLHSDSEDMNAVRRREAQKGCKENFKAYV